MHHPENNPCFHLPFHETAENIPMYKCKHTSQVDETHQWMEAGYHNLLEATNARWRVLDWMYELLVPGLMYAKSVAAVIPKINSLPSTPFFITGGSWLTNGRSSGAIAIGDAEMLTY